MEVATGVLTAVGGKSSHAAVVARGMGLPCVVGAGSLHIEEHKKQFTVKAGTKDVVVKEGDWISFDGTTADVYLGQAKTKEPDPNSPLFVEFMKWADEFRGKFGVRANADIPRDAKAARAFGAEGIGLCRTEHMFFAADRIPHMQAMILAEDEKTRSKALQKLLPMQRKDFAGLFEAMDGYPVIIRTLDPPLHEFLPKRENLMVDIARLPHASSKEKKEMSETYGFKVGELKKKLPDLLKRVEDLHEFNPMLGFRGCRLGIVHTAITEMQARAIFEAVVQVAKKGVKVIPEVMIPLVGFQRELAMQTRNCRPRRQGSAGQGRHEGFEVHDRHHDRDPARRHHRQPDRRSGRLLQLRHQRPDPDHARHVARRLHQVLEEVRRTENLQSRSVPDH